MSSLDLPVNDVDHRHDQKGHRQEVKVEGTQHTDQKKRYGEYWNGYVGELGDFVQVYAQTGGFRHVISLIWDSAFIK